MIFSVIYYLILLLHLFPVAYIFLLRSPEYLSYYRSNVTGKIIVSSALILLCHMVFQLFFGDVFSLYTAFVLILEITALVVLANVSNSGLNPIFANSGADLSGKLVLVTGGNSGTGLASALSLAKLGASVIIASRNDKLSKQVCDDINKYTTNNNRAEYLTLDLSSLQEIRNFADKFKQKHDKLDILINNAGMVSDIPGKTVDGFEKHFAVMHLGHFLLTILLLPLLQKTKGSRVINTASEAHRLCNAELLEAKNFTNTLKPGPAYGRAKTSNILFTREFAKRYGNSVAAFCLHPGCVYTNIWIVPKGGIPYLFEYIGKVFDFLAYYLMRTPEEGVQEIIMLATLKDIEKNNGKYFMCLKEHKPTAIAQDDNLAKEFWNNSEEAVKKFLQ